MRVDNVNDVLESTCRHAPGKLVEFIGTAVLAVAILEQRYVFIGYPLQVFIGLIAWKALDQIIDLIAGGQDDHAKADNQCLSFLNLSHRPESTRGAIHV
jgi:hypothetical protein